MGGGEGDNVSVTKKRAVNEKRNSSGVSFTVDLSRKEGERKKKKKATFHL